MPSIKQIIAEIQLAPDLNDRQKVVIRRLIEEAIERLKLKAPRAPRKITGAKNLVTIEEWEAEHGGIEGSGLSPWVEKYGLSVPLVLAMVQEFRAEMQAKGKQYANFKMAFQTYLTKGYLSKRLEQCKVSPITVVHTKGIDL